MRAAWAMFVFSAGCHFLVNGLPIAGSDGAAPLDLATGGDAASAADLSTAIGADLAPPFVFSRLDLIAGSDFGFADGNGAGAKFNDPNGLATDGTNLYVADINNALVRMIDANANVTTLAGVLGQQSESDGTGTQATFNQPVALAWDGSKSSLWVVDLGGSTVRQIVVAGAAVSTLIAPGVLNAPKGIVADGAGNLYVSDAGNAVIRKIVIATSTVSTVAGMIGQPGLKDGTGTAAQINEPRGLALDGAGALYFADGMNNAIRKIVLATGAVTTVAGGFRFPRGVVLDGAGTLFVADTEHNCVEQIVLATAQVSVVAGVCGTAVQVLGPLTTARTFSPWGLVRLPSGALVYTDNASSDVLIIH